MVAGENIGDAERSALRLAMALRPGVLSGACQAYHIDFVRCVIRKSFARPEGGEGGA